MARRVTISNISSAARLLSQRVVISLFAAFAIGMMIFAKTQEKGIDEFRLAIAATAAPVLSFLAEPVQAINKGIANVHGFFNTYEENKRLRAEIAHLQYWRSQAQSLADQNRLLATELRLKNPTTPLFVTAPILADSGGPFVRTRLLRAGAAQGLIEDQAALSQGVLVGRLVTVADNMSRLLLLTDLNSRVPVRLEGSRALAILSGDNSDDPKLIHLPIGTQVSIGTQVVTSGDAGVFPIGLPIGRVSQITKKGAIVKLYANIDGLEYVSIVKTPPIRTKGIFQAPFEVDGTK